MHPRLRDRAIRLVVMSSLAGVWLIGGPNPAAAECDGPIPSFRGVAASATRVVIGEVVEIHPSELTADGADGRSSRFTLRVLEVVRGRAPKTMEIVDLVTQPCAGVVIARLGDRLAIAFDALDFEPPMRVNTAAWLRGIPPFSEIDSLSAFESTTREQVHALLGVEPPDTAVASEVERAARGVPWWPLIFAGLVGGIAGWRRRALEPPKGGRRVAR